MSFTFVRFPPFFPRIEGLILFYRLFVYIIIFRLSSTLKLHCYIFALLRMSVWFPCIILKPIFETQNLSWTIIRGACITMQLTFPPKTYEQLLAFSLMYLLAFPNGFLRTWVNIEFNQTYWFKRVFCSFILFFFF